jgi:hypothetical protein
MRNSECEIRNAGRGPILAGVVIALVVASDIRAGEPTTNTPPGPNTRPPLFVIGTRAYDEQLRSFAVTPQRARLLAQRIAHGQVGEQFGDVGWHVAIVGDEYVFSSEWDKTYMFLEGYFVNGKTGVAQARRTTWKVRFRDYPELAARVKERLESNRTQ